MRAVQPSACTVLLTPEQLRLCVCTWRVPPIQQRALQKFKGDLRLWTQYFEFCESTGANKALGTSSLIIN